MRKRVLICLLLLLGYFKSQSQLTLDAPKLILPAPEAFSFTKYGDIPVGLFTGTMNYSIPLMQLQNGKISLPISLDYASNGIKVDEVSGRTGMGWTLRSGGVITRNIVGKADNSGALVAPPNNDSVSTAFYNYMKLAAENNYNTQPDEYTYSFGGYSGKFYFDYSGNVKQISPDGIKIEKIGLDEFKLTTPDAFQYFFEPKETSESYSAYREVDPLYTAGQYGTTAWYLTKIISNTGDVVQFKYSLLASCVETPLEYFSSIQQTQPVYQYPNSIGASLRDIFIQSGTCAQAGTIAVGNDLAQCLPSPATFTIDYNKSKVTVVRLDEINFKTGKLLFHYSSRNDLPGEEKLDSLVLWSIPGNKRLKVVRLDYVYSTSSPTYSLPLAYEGLSGVAFQERFPYLTKRLYLEKAVFVNPQSAGDVQQYKFEYDNFNDLPPRLSFAQDKFGFFNGKVNGSFIPSNTLFHMYMPFLTGGADREVDTNFVKKGVLKKITYPTGGYTSVEYESNQISSYNRRVDDTLTLKLNYDSINNVIFSEPFSAEFSLRLDVEASWIIPPPPIGPNDPQPSDDSLATVSITDITGNIVYTSIDVRPGQLLTYSNNMYFFSGINNFFRLKIETIYPNVKAKANFHMFSFDNSSYNKPTGGVRVKAIRNFASGNTLSSFKRFDYNLKTGDSSQNRFSSGALINDFQDNRDFFRLEWNVCDNEFRGVYYTLTSSSGLGGFVNDYLSVNYQYVTEYLDSAGVNGRIINQFQLAQNRLPTTFRCAPVMWLDSVGLHSHWLIPGAPYTNMGALNGKPIKQIYFKNTGGSYSTVKEVNSYYSIDNRLYNVDSFYVIKAHAPRSSHYTGVNYFGDYDINKYKRISAWSHLDSTITKEYGGNNISMTTKTLYTYGNSTHLQLTKQATIRSAGDTLFSNTKYPADLALTTLTNKNFHNVPILQENYVGIKATNATKINYKIIGNNIVPDSVQTSTGTYPFETELKFTQYDNYGNPLEFVSKGQRGTILFDTTVNAMAAGCQNAALTDIAFTSFETAYPGNWTIASPVRDSGNFITGKKSYLLNNGNITKSGLTIGRMYIVSYWSTSSAKSISGGMVNTRTGKTVNGWTLYESTVTASSTTITISGSGLLDELRLYPRGSEMNSYTYDPLIGATSQNDVNNVITYYEYDNFNRLKNIKDFEGSIVKNFQYNYLNTCGGNCYVLPLQTPNGNIPGSYPVGVFNVNDSLLGNVATPAAYVSLWNGNTANQVLGTLALGSDSMHFNFSPAAGKTPPNAVMGARYYQYDLDYNYLDCVRSINGCYVDWGDGEKMKLFNFHADTLPPVLSPNTVRLGGAFAHTYPNNNLKTITLYHQDQNEYSHMDNRINGNNAVSLTHLKNLRGNFPQMMQQLGSSCYQNATASTLVNIANWYNINTVTIFSMNPGDGVTPNANINYAQDFMQNNKNLKTIYTSNGGFYNSGLRDSTFKLSRLKTGWNTYFTALETMWISDEHWNREDLSALVNLKTFLFVAGNQKHSNDPTNNPVVPVPSNVLDNIIIQIAAGSGQRNSNGLIWFNAGGTYRTSASNSAFNFLKSKGWVFYIDGVTIE